MSSIETSPIALEHKLSFKTEFKPNYEVTRQQSIRCFPSCCNEHHFEKTFCGSCIEVFVSNSAVLRDHHQAQVYTEIVPADAAARAEVGDKPEQEWDNDENLLIARRTNTRDMFMVSPKRRKWTCVFDHTGKLRCDVIVRAYLVVDGKVTDMCQTESFAFRFRTQAKAAATNVVTGESTVARRTTPPPPIPRRTRSFPTVPSPTPPPQEAVEQAPVVVPQQQLQQQMAMEQQQQWYNNYYNAYYYSAAATAAAAAMMHPTVTAVPMAQPPQVDVSTTTNKQEWEKAWSDYYSQVFSGITVDYPQPQHPMVVMPQQQIQQPVVFGSSVPLLAGTGCDTPARSKRMRDM